MKTKCITRLMIMVILYMYPILSHSTIITVDNNFPSQGDFTTLQAAHDAASNGDTILIYPSLVPYDGITLMKRLIIIGSGYNENGNVKIAIIQGGLTCNSGSDGSIIEAVSFVENINGTSITIYANNITIKRNKLNRIHLSSPLTGTIISGNYFFNPYYGVPSNASIIMDNNNELLIENNIIIEDRGTAYGQGILIGGASVSGSICNNVIFISDVTSPYNYAIDLNGSNCIAYNNIVINGFVVGTAFFNNMGNGTQFPADNGNMQNVSMSEVFVDHNSYDFHLKPGSPAFGNGLNGDDMGVYGGARPFVDHGYPGIPSIYFLNVPFYTTPQEGLNVTIKAKSNPQ